MTDKNTFYNMLKSNAESQPDAVAVVYDTMKVTYAKLFDDVTKKALHFQKFEGKRIAIFGPASYRWIVNMFGTIVAGKELALVDFFLPHDSSQEVILNLLFPGACLYVLISLINNLSKEEMLGKMAELLDTAVSWGLKTLLGMVVGLQVVRGLIAPVMDTLKRSALGKAAGALPGVGNAVNMVTELVLTSAVLVRNCLGVVILFAFVAAGAGPVIHYGILSLLYRFLAAIAQPVSEKRIVDSLATMGEGCALLLRILFTAEILCILDFVILMTGIGGSG